MAELSSVCALYVIGDRESKKEDTNRVSSGGICSLERGTDVGAAEAGVGHQQL